MGSRPGRITGSRNGKIGMETERVIRTNERRTHGARLIREGDHDLSFPTSVRQLVPLLLWCTHIVEIWCESDSTHIDIVAHVVRNTVTSAFWFIGAEVTLKGNLRVSRDVAGTLHTHQCRIIMWMAVEVGRTMSLDTCRPAVRCRHPAGSTRSG